MCEHIYKTTNVGICNMCGKPSHNIDWEKEHALRAAHVAEKGIFYNVPGTWWSI